MQIKRNKKYCPNCKTELQPKAVKGIFFNYCPEKLCPRYGLLTMVWVELEASNG